MARSGEHGRGVFDDAFLLGGAVEPADQTPPEGNGGRGAASVLEVASEAFDSVDVAQAAVVLPAPDGELAQIQRVRVAGNPR
jgi:hypothetical protein